MLLNGNLRGYMSKLTYWKHQKETQYVLQELDQDIEDLKDKICDGYLLEAPNIESAYTMALGELKGLRALKAILERDKEEIEDDSVIEE